MKSTKAWIAGASAAVVLATSALIIPSEGLSLKTYRDPIGILTYCYGETAGAVAGRTYTPDQCRTILEARVNSFEQTVSGCLPNYASLPDPTKASLISITYNVGPGMCRSTMFRLLRAGNIEAACGEFSKFVYAGGRVLPGLVKRRAAERAMCLKGVHP